MTLYQIQDRHSEQPLSDISENITIKPDGTVALSPDTRQTSEQPSSDIPVKPDSSVTTSPDN